MYDVQALQKKISLAAKASLIATGFAIPVSVTGYSVLMVLTIILALLSGDVKHTFRMAMRNQVILVALLLYALLLISVFYTSAPWSEASNALQKYEKLLFIFFLAPLFLQERWKLAGVYAFLAAMLVTLAVSYMKWFGWNHIGYGGYDTIFTNHINTGFMMAFAAFILAHRCFSNVKFRWLYAILLLLVSYNLFFLSQGRTGYLVFLGLFALFLWQKLAWKGLLVCVAAVPLLLIAAFFFSSSFNQRIMNVFSDMRNYQHQELYGNSIGLRVVFSKNSINLIEQSPFIGTGVGSFKTEYRQHFPPDPGFANIDNPQNEYLMIGVQLGIVGLLVFLWLMYAIWRAGSALPPLLHYLAQGMVVAFMLGALCDTFLYLSVSGYFFTFFAALFSFPCAKKI